VTSSRRPIIEARGLTRILPGEVPTTLVDTVDLTVNSGEFLAITGPSGSGKSSLLYLLGLLDVPTRGDVFIDGAPTATMAEEERAARRLADLGFVFQFHFLLPEFTASENVMLPMRALAESQHARARELGLTRESAMRARADALLASFGLADHAWKRPDQLSGGQRQRVAIARALANDPKVILADEPTGNLDTASTDQVFAILGDLVANQDRTIVVVTHDLALAARADRRVHVVDGHIARDWRQDSQTQDSQTQDGETQDGETQGRAGAGPASP
jgi:lipoprotein-releasing system ATP-binding protein